jgi:hypothetical protein
MYIPKVISVFRFFKEEVAMLGCPFISSKVLLK